MSLNTVKKITFVNSNEINLLYLFLQKMLKYYKDLKTLFDYLPADVSKAASKTALLRPASTMDTCQPTDVENAVSRIFCEDGGKNTQRNRLGFIEGRECES